MRDAPTPLAIVRYPVTGGLALLALGVTVAQANGVDVSALYENPRISDGEVWRLVTSVLPHAGPVHLVFNLYWLWVLGSLVEEAFGYLRTAALYVLLALGSGAAEYATFGGGIGLSGVVYGVFGILAVLSYVRRSDVRFTGAIDTRTAGLFVGWFFLCIAATAAGVARIGNVAHGAGLVLGALAGLAVASRGPARAAWAAACGVIVCAAVAGATVGRPWVNVARDRGAGEAALGRQAVDEKRYEEAVRWYREAVKMHDRNADWWYGLAFSLYHAGRPGEALEGFRRAAELAPEKADYVAEYERQKAYQSAQPSTRGTDG